MQLNELVTRSKFIRQAYHTLEKKHHGSEWTINEDLLALSNDIGNLDRLVMTKEGRYYDETPYQLSEKLAENIWWLIELSQRLNIDIETELEKFLAKKEQQLSIDLEKNNDKK
ncbi:MazG-like protein [Limosilactobacillus reuteri]|uniref:MazG-like protein n=1 Tax=Limosilactobacillus reuteri TaxID=1598 RepID=UPI001E30D7F9|nr:MazG-like protein [Limosilactobacillus reuteri]MCC4421059.1 MazG-like protein [Limosilactobacillus reuteri]